MRVAIINSSSDTCEMLEAYFHMEGWESVAVTARDLREGTITGAILMATYQPDAILFDVAIPYDANWSTLQRLRADPAVTCPIIVTTTNEPAIHRFVGIFEPIQEIVGKPYDLARLKNAIATAVEGPHPPRREPEVNRRAGDRRWGDRRSSSRLQESDASNDSPDRPSRGKRPRVM